MRVSVHVSKKMTESENSYVNALTSQSKEQTEREREQSISTRRAERRGSLKVRTFVSVSVSVHVAEKDDMKTPRGALCSPPSF